MKTNKQKINWVLDAGLFAVFLLSFVLDLTGLALHQWLGLFAGVLALLHLVLHWNWVKCVTVRFLGRTTWQARIYYVLDVGIMLGFALILATGVLISSWLSLFLDSYFVWKSVHVAVSIVTLGLVVLKVALHWRWVVSVFHRLLPITAPKVRRVETVPARTAIGRRQFLRMMGIVGAGACVAMVSASRALTDSLAQSSAPADLTALAASLATPLPLTTEPSGVGSNSAVASSPTATPSPSELTQSTPSPSCRVLCPRACSYPGQCRRYIDRNGNGRCDNGECL